MEAKTIQKLLEHFGARSNGEISLLCKQEGIIIKSKLDDFIDRNAKLNKSVSTEVRVDKRHFRTYHVEEEAELIFAMREFKAAIALADHLSLPLELNFSQAGAPIIIKLQCPTMVAQIFIATSIPPVEEQSQEQTTTMLRDTSHQVQRNSIEAEESAMAMDEMQDAQLHSGRSAMKYNLNVPLQSTAPAAPAPRNGENLFNHDDSSISTALASVPEVIDQQPQEPLFFDDPTSPEQQYDMETDDADMIRAMEDVEARLTQQQSTGQDEAEHQRRYIDTNPARPTSDVLYDLMRESEAPREETAREEESETIREEKVPDEEENEFTFDDDEELPSTQHESDPKKSKYNSLF